MYSYKYTKAHIPHRHLENFIPHRHLDNTSASSTSSYAEPTTSNKLCKTA